MPVRTNRSATASRATSAGARALATVAMALLALPWAPTVYATGDFGAHLENFEEHVDDYEADVRALIETLDGIVADYAQDGEAPDGMRPFIEHWERVGYHGAVETQAQTLYPPIWMGIGRLNRALANQAPLEEVRAGRERLEVALWQGMGGVKLAAARRRAGGGGRQAAAPHDHEDRRQDVDAATTVDRIQESLAEAIASYRQGRVDRARKTIHDAYMERFEGLEGELIERDAQLVAGLEEDFNASLPLLLEEGAPVSEVRALVEQMNAELDRARELLRAAEDERSEVF